uniref:uncharacterized protein LOC125416330 isoform X1 n=2 Tax=Myodes glareolus TaxID=447135 RepID=UPI002020C833|nr:uncharacterized protein LOC125416330 isoform X1 [Myodes glareolus]
MAGGDNGSSSRTSSGYLSEEESADYGLIFKHFRENKVEIASAITDPFPFLMSLRDRGYISEQKFRNYQQNCEKQIPVGRVVYDILSDLQNKFTLSLLKLIFSPTHLKAYPDLKETFRNFPNGKKKGYNLSRVKRRRTWCLFSEAAAEETPAFAMADEKPKEGVKTKNNDHINLKVAGQDGSVVQIKIKRHIPLSKLMKAYCERQGLSMRQTRFRFDGQPIYEADTPALLEMEDEDTIDVFQQLTGGVY